MFLAPLMRVAFKLSVGKGVRNRAVQAGPTGALGLRVQL